jgi:hypothetical protein
LKISVFTGYSLSHPEVDIRCKEKNQEVERIISAVNTCSNKITAKINDEQILINPHHVLYFESVNKKTYVYLKNQVAEVAFRLFEITDANLFFGYVRISNFPIHWRCNQIYTFDGSYASFSQFGRKFDACNYSDVHDGTGNLYHRKNTKKEWAGER